jgi:hypothetical protein
MSNDNGRESEVKLAPGGNASVGGDVAGRDVIKTEVQGPNPAVVILAIVVVVAVVGLAVILGIVAVSNDQPNAATAPARTPPPTVTFTPTPLLPIEIIAPRSGASVRPQIAVNGRLTTELCAGCSVYVVIRPVVAEEKTRWYGQSAAAALGPDSEFFLDKVNVGRDVHADDCKKFEIWVVVSPDPLQEIHMDDDQWVRVAKIASAMVQVQRECPSPQ